MGKNKHKKSLKRALKCRIKEGQKQKNFDKKQKKYKMIAKDTKIPEAKLVAVYGTLLSNLSNNRLLNNSKLIGEFWTEPKYRMYASPSKHYPYLIEGGPTSVKMELYSFSDDTTEANLDDLEGVAGGLYEKQYIPTPGGIALVYVRKLKMSDNDDQVFSGCWKDYKNIEK